MAARLLYVTALVCDCSALLLGDSTLRHSVSQDTVSLRRCATVQMDLSWLASDHVQLSLSSSEIDTLALNQTQRGAANG
jgi:hypothetical protein